MTEASADKILAFVGDQFSSIDQLGTTAPADTAFMQLKNSEEHEIQAIALEEDRYRGMTPMERYLACRNQPFQITAAKPPTGSGKGSNAGDKEGRLEKES